MKKINILKLTIFFIIVLTSNITTQAQTVELTASYGYQFGSKINYGWNNSIQLKESDQYAFTLGVDMFEGMMTEVTWVHHSTAINVYDPRFENSKIADLNADWITAGASKYFEYDKFRPFIGGGLGLAIFNSKNESIEVGPLNTQYYFAVSGKAGVNYMFTESFGLNIQANLMVPVQWGGFYIGTGGGGISASSTTLVGGFSGGLVYRLN